MAFFWVSRPNLPTFVAPHFVAGGCRVRTKQTKQAAYDSALEAVKAFYGLSNGGEVALANAREALIKAKLSMDQIGDLREALPPPC